VWLVELAELRDRSLVAQAVSDALPIPRRTSQDPLAVLVDFLAYRELLLILDNCEHLLPESAVLVADLLRAAPGLRVLATSREVLGIPGEQVCPVPPLPVPDPGEVAALPDGLRYPGVALFADRATARYPRFVLSADNLPSVARLCQRLEGIPLAIELAAARLRALSLAQLTELLDDRFRLLAGGNHAALPRHQTLRSAVEWSYDLCTKPERELWLHASVFAGRFELVAITVVCGAAGDAVDEPLAGLVDKSVLTAEDHGGNLRYRMLDTLREYGLERLRSATEPSTVDEEVVRRRHRDFYLDLAERFDADWFGPRQAYWADRMRADRADLRAALGFCLERPDEVRAGVRLAAALQYLWWGSGESREGRLWLERALAADPRPSPDRARALACYLRILLTVGLPAEVAAPARECEALARRFDDRLVLIDALQSHGHGLVYSGDLEAGLPLLEEAAQRALALGRRHPARAYSTLMLAIALLFHGDPDRAEELLAESRSICRDAGDRWWLGIVLNVSALSALRRDDLPRAADHGREALLTRTTIDPVGTSGAVEILGWVAAAAGEYPQAARLLGAADRQWKAYGGSPFAGEWANERRTAKTAARQALGAAFDAEYAEGGGLSLDDAVAYALGERTEPAHPLVPTGPSRLTRRENEIAELIAQGLSNREIATKLVISQRTAESHVENILTKFGFTTRTQIAAWYAEHHDR
jgi:non-specific serine/threonine protein kinase